MVSFRLNGQDVSVASDEGSLLDLLRDQFALVGAKDGCAPQGQCGCCTVWVDGDPRVACVTPARRVVGREIVTLEGLDSEVASQWSSALCATGATQCGFCTPGIVMRLEALRVRGDLSDEAAVGRSLAAHLCRCTGWRPIFEAAGLIGSAGDGTIDICDRDLDSAGERATLEGHAPQRVAPDVALGRGGFSADTAPPGSLVAMLDANGHWMTAETMVELRVRTQRVQGRRTTLTATTPLAVPDGEWTVELTTSWVEPGYLECDAAWCEPGGTPSTALANGGAFGAKRHSLVGVAASQLAAEHGRPVLALYSREDVVRLGPKRPPMALGIRADGTGTVRVARTAGVREAIARVAPAIEVIEVDVPGPPTSVDLRGAGWIEVAVAIAAASGAMHIVSPEGAVASAQIVVSVGGTEPGSDDPSASSRPTIAVQVECGRVLDEVALRSACIGAAHQALGWVTSEALTLDDSGEPVDLTIRSFGIVRPGEMPRVDVEIIAGSGPAVNGSDAVVAAVALAIWKHQGFPAAWPTGRALEPFGQIEESSI